VFWLNYLNFVKGLAQPTVPIIWTYLTSNTSIIIHLIVATLQLPLPFPLTWSRFCGFNIADRQVSLIL